MAEDSGISWTDHTVNFWWGCSKVSPACEHCYAERLDARFHLHPHPMADPGTSTHWGPTAPRKLRVEAATSEAFRYQRRAVKEGRRFRVFTNSMADFFEDRRDLDAPRLAALDVIRQTPNLDWLILTKRPGRIVALLERAHLDACSHAQANRTEPSGLAFEELARWLRNWISPPIAPPPANVWLGTTAENQVWADKRVPALLAVPAAVRFLSCEPLLGPVDPRLKDCWLGYTPTRDLLHWIIAGGESGPHARPMHPDWARSLRDQCAEAGVPFHFKQWGEYLPAEIVGHCGFTPDGDPIGGNFEFADQTTTPHFGRSVPLNPVLVDLDKVNKAFRIGTKAAGRLLDGVLHDSIPEAVHGPQA